MSFRWVQPKNPGKYYFEYYVDQIEIAFNQWFDSNDKSTNSKEYKNLEKACRDWFYVGKKQSFQYDDEFNDNFRLAIEETLSELSAE